MSNGRGILVRKIPVCFIEEVSPFFNKECVFERISDKGDNGQGSIKPCSFASFFILQSFQRKAFL